MSKKYAQLSWQAGDVQPFKPNWTLEQCEEWLEYNQRYIADRLCELGFEVIETLLPPEDEYKGASSCSW